MLEQFFGLRAKGTSVRVELLAGLTTFLTMAYIIFVNPDILSTTGMDPSAAARQVATKTAFRSIPVVDRMSGLTKMM